MARIETTITVNGKAMGTERVSEEFAQGIANYNFNDMQEVNMILQAEYRCWRKDLFDWCPADTKTLKQMLGMEV